MSKSQILATLLPHVFPLCGGALNDAFPRFSRFIPAFLFGRCCHGDDVEPPASRRRGALWVPTQDGCALARVLKKFPPRRDSCPVLAPEGSPVSSSSPHCPRARQVWPEVGAAVANCAREDGPRLQPLPVAKSRGERSRAFPCKHAPVHLALDGFDLLYRLWTLPYTLLTRIICATVSLIVRRRRSSSARVDHHTAARSAGVHASATPSQPP